MATKKTPVRSTARADQIHRVAEFLIDGGNAYDAADTLREIAEETQRFVDLVAGIAAGLYDINRALGLPDDAPIETAVETIEMLRAS